MKLRYLLALLVVPALIAQTPPPGAKVKEIFARYNHTDTPGCTAGASMNGNIVLEAAYGMADLEHAVALTPDSIIEAGSVSKQFTAGAVLLLAQAGKLSLDDPVRKYIPELPDYGAPLTIRHMINHTSGLRDWGSVADLGGWPRTTRAYTHGHVLEILSRQRELNYPPGAEYSYSNSGYNLAAILVSRVSGKSFADFTREAIFEPLGMASTSWRDDYRRIVPKRATGYADYVSPIRTLMPFESVHGNGGLLTTVGDLLRWNRNFTEKKVGGDAFVAAQLQRGRLTNGFVIAYAAGLMIGSFQGVNEVSHSGATAGYRAWLARYPEQGLSIAVLCNAGSANAGQLGREVATVYLKDALKKPQETEMASIDVAPFAGLYSSRRTHSTVSFTAADGKLRMGNRTVRAFGNSSFAINETTRVEFTASGAVIKDAYGEHVYDRVERWTPALAELDSFTGEYTSVEAEVSLTVALEGQGLVIRRRPDDKFALKPAYKDAFEGEVGSVRFISDATGRVTELSIGDPRAWDMRFKRVR